MRKRNPEKYVVNYCNTERYGRSAVPFLQRLLNEDYAKQKKDLKCLLQVNNDIFNNVPITFLIGKYTLLYTLLLLTIF